MEFRPTCAVPGCGGLGIYRCGQCHRAFCGQHAEVLSEISAHWVAGPWRVYCQACRQHVSDPASSWTESPWNEPPWAGNATAPGNGSSTTEQQASEAIL
jgi:hypothetical protein